MPPEPIQERILQLKASVEKALRAAGRPAGSVEIVLVTKTVAPEKIQEALACGVLDLGENRVQELLEKASHLNPSPIKWGEEKVGGIRWHFIGHLQTNKVKQVLGRAAMIHSLDRPELAEEIERQAKIKKIISVPCLVQVNSSGEVSKFGLKPEAVEAFVAGLKGPAIQVRGLMTIGPLTDDAEKIRRAFRSVRELQQRLKNKFPDKNWETISMGMSQDYEIAIQEGATMIRVGAAVFGERK